MSGCFKVAVVGIGGFAGAHHSALLDLEATGLLKVIATCDPAAAELGERRRKYRFGERGVAIFETFDALLEKHGTELDWVSVISPIRFHADHHRACVSRGIACYLEKPPTLDPAELREMLRIESTARSITQVGFNCLSQPWRQTLKMRLVRGDFGPLQKVAFKGLWRRSREYYERNSWAGRMFLGDYLLLDSCCGNAMSHFLHNFLFHAGTDEILSWARPHRVEAELYRANPNEGPDTVFARGILSNGVQFLLAASHACETQHTHIEILQCEDARIEIPEKGLAQIIRRGKTVETFEVSPASVKNHLNSYCDYLLGDRQRPVTTLADCRSVVDLNALLYLAAGHIHTVSAPYASARDFSGESRETMVISDIESAFDGYWETERFPSEAALPWAKAGGRADAAHLGRLRPVLNAMRGAVTPSQATSS